MFSSCFWLFHDSPTHTLLLYTHPLMHARCACGETRAGRRVRRVRRRRRGSRRRKSGRSGAAPLARAAAVTTPPRRNDDAIGNTTMTTRSFFYVLIQFDSVRFLYFVSFVCVCSFFFYRFAWFLRSRSAVCMADRKPNPNLVKKVHFSLRSPNTFPLNTKFIHPFHTSQSGNRRRSQ